MVTKMPSVVAVAVDVAAESPADSVSVAVVSVVAVVGCGVIRDPDFRRCRNCMERNN